jgi:hypothetical protein
MSGLVAALGIGLGVQLLGIAQTIEVGRFDIDAYETAAGLLGLLGVAQVLLILVTAFAFIAWHSRVVEVIPALGLGTPRWSPRWAIVFWLVPLANLVVPYLSLRDVARRLPGGPWTLLMVGWWVLWVVAGILDRVLAADPGPTIETLAIIQAWLQRVLLLLVISQLAYLGAALLGILVVRRMERAIQRVATARPPEWRRPPDAAALTWGEPTSGEGPVPGWPGRRDG